MKKKQSAHAIILDREQKQILLVKRRDIPVWVLPGGGIEEGETPEMTAHREAFEETGLTIELVEKIGTYLPRNSLSNESHVFECVPHSGNLTLTNETQDIQWFPLDHLPPLPPPYPEWIEDGYAKKLMRPFTKKIVSVNYFAFIKNIFLHPILITRFLLSRLGIHLNTAKDPNVQK